MQNYKSISAFILCGGQSRRMGRNKALIEWRGQPFIQWVIDAINPLQISIVLSTADSEFEKFGLPLLEDIFPEKGPLGGLVSILKNTKSQYNLVLSCDVPMITTEVLELLIEAHLRGSAPITIASHQGKHHPLVGIYNKSIVPDIERNIVLDKLKLMTFLDEVGWQKVEVADEFTLLNVNAPADLNTLNNIVR